MSPRMVTVAETGSTNDDMKRLAAAGEPEGSWLRAERQTGGRGRHGRAWQSVAGNLHASTIVRLRETDPPAPGLALVAAVALDQVLAARIPMPGATMIKWPNDILVSGAKIAGILLEREGDAVVMGFGVNVAHAPDVAGRAVTSLADQGGGTEPESLLPNLAESVRYWLGRWRGGGRTDPVRARWLERAHPLGSALNARVSDTVTLTGLFDGVDGQGALRLRLADGTVRVIHAGDVTLA